MAISSAYFIVNPIPGRRPNGFRRLSLPDGTILFLSIVLDDKTVYDATTLARLLSIPRVGG